MVDPALVMFAIEAGVKIGRKIYDVLVETTESKALLLPFGPLAGSIALAEAQEFFDEPQNQPLVADGGPYAALQGKPGLIDAYRTVRQINVVVGADVVTTKAGVEVILNLQKFEQHKEGFGPHSPVQQILGTVVEVGIDYFAANPQSLGKDSSARKVVTAFLVGIGDIDFAEGEPSDVVRDVLVEALTTLGDNRTLVAHDARLSALLGGVTTAVRDDIQSAGSLGDSERRSALFKRIGMSILKAGAGTVADNPGLFLPGEGRGKVAVRGTVTAILDSIRDSADLFSNTGLENLCNAALDAAADNAVFITNDVLRSLLKNTVHELTAANARALFRGAAVEQIVLAALETVAENSETLIDPTTPQRQLIARAVAALAQGLGTTLAGPGNVKDLFSTRQLVQLAKIVFGEVADHPEQLLGGDGTNPRRTALAQILASVASSLGSDPTRLVTAAGLTTLIGTAMQVAVKNQDKLLDLNNEDPRSNLLHAILAAVSGSLLAAGANGRLVDRDTYIEIGRRILPLVSNNLDRIIGTDARLIRDTVTAALALGSGALENRMNANTFPVAVEGLLRSVLLDSLTLDDDAAVAKAAGDLLRLAA